MHRTPGPARNPLIAGLLVATLLAGPATGAGPVAGTFQAWGTTTLHGPHDLAWDTAGASLRPPDQQVGSAELGLHGARVQWINIPYTVVVTHTGVVDRAHSGFGDEEVVLDRTATGTVTVRLDGDGEVRLLPQGPLRLQSDATAATVHPAGSALAPPPNSTVQGLAFVQRTDIFLPLPHTHAQARDLRVDGTRADALVPSGTVWLPGEDGPRDAGRRLNESRSHFDPATGSGIYVYDTWVLLVTGGRLDAATDGLDWHLAATRLRGDLDGTARWQGVVGAVAVNGTRTTDDPAALEVEGTVRLASDLRAAPLRWSLGGDAVRVDLDNEPFWQSPAAGLGALAAAGLLAVALRSLATLILGSTTPGLLKARLDSPSRLRILRAIHAHQPVRPADLSRLTGLSRGSLRYHLRVLEAHDVLQEHVPPGGGRRSLTLLLNSGSHAFRTAGVAALVADAPATVRADGALAVVHGHPLRRALYDALRTHGPGDFAALRDRLREAGVEADLKQSRASYHLLKLSDAGAVVDRWVDGRKVYEANLDPVAVRAEQYRRFLRQHGALQLVRSLAAGDMDRAEVLAHLGRHRSRRSAVRTLQDLVAVAVLEPAPRPGRYRLTPPLQDLAPTLGDPS